MRLAAEAIQPLSAQDVNDLSASFQAAIVDVVVERTRAGLRAFRERFGQYPQALVVAGGVAANQSIRRAVQRLAIEAGLKLVIPPPKLCTDNGAMIAWAGTELLTAGLIDDMETPARARWPLDSTAAPVVGSGRLGVKV